MDNNKDIEMATKPSTGTRDNTFSPKDSSEDRPPTPSKRDFKVESSAAAAEFEPRRRTRLFPRPEVIYKPESTKNWMGCLKLSLIIFNLLIWVFGAVLTGIGVWVKMDPDFWEIQTQLGLTKFSMASTILIITGVVIMVVGFLGCYGAIAESLCMLILFAVVVFIIILLEIAVIALAWTAVTNKDAKDHIKAKAKEALQKRIEDEFQLHFINIIQKKFKCCGIEGPNDYEFDSIPRSCTNPEDGLHFQKGCFKLLVEYCESKASLVGGIAIAVFLLQVGVLVLTLCVACGLKNGAKNAIF